MTLKKQSDRDEGLSRLNRRNFIIRSGAGFAALGMVTLYRSQIVSTTTSSDALRSRLLAVFLRHQTVESQGNPDHQRR